MRFATLLLPFLFVTSALADVPISQLPGVPSSKYAPNVVRVWRHNSDGTKTLIYERSGRAVASAPRTSKPSSLMYGEVAYDARAYAHAKREAQMLANGMWYNSRKTGHPLGRAPGCRYSGTGMSSDGQPRHCYMGMGGLVARACVYKNGTYYWSAHFR